MSASRFVLLAAFALLACHRGVGPDYRPAMYPYPGFGRVGCYEFERADAAARGRDPAFATRGPWLVLDTLVGIDTAWGHAGRPASYIARQRDSLVAYWADWWHAGDTIRVDLGTYPPTHWALRREGDKLVGEGWLVSDVVMNGRTSTSRWPVRAQAISCAQVPIVRAPE